MVGERREEGKVKELMDYLINISQHLILGIFLYSISQLLLNIPLMQFCIDIVHIGRPHIDVSHVHMSKGKVLREDDN